MPMPVFKLKVSTVRQEQMDARLEHASHEFSSSSQIGSSNNKGGRAVIRGGCGHEVRSIRGGIPGRKPAVVRGGSSAGAQSSQEGSGGGILAFFKS